MSVADINFRGKGASPGEWDAVIAAGLLEQMLPVVQNPGLPRSPASALKTVGKVPSQLNAYGEVVGFPPVDEARHHGRRGRQVAPEPRHRHLHPPRRPYGRDRLRRGR